MSHREYNWSAVDGWVIFFGAWAAEGIFWVQPLILLEKTRWGKSVPEQNYLLLMWSLAWNESLRDAKLKQNPEQKSPANKKVLWGHNPI